MKSLIRAKYFLLTLLLNNNLITNEMKTICTFVFILFTNLIIAQSGILPVIPFGHSDDIETVEFSPDGKCVLSSSIDGYILIWSVEHGKVLRILENMAEDTKSCHWSPDGSKILACFKEKPNESFLYKVWDARTGELLFKREADYFINGNWSPDGSKIAITDGKYIKIISSENGKLINKLKNKDQMGGGFSPKWSPDGEKLYFFGVDPVIWNINTGKSDILPSAFRKRYNPETINWSPDCKYLVTTGFDGKAYHEYLVILDAESGDSIGMLDSIYGEIVMADWLPEGDKIIAASAHTGVSIVDVKTNEIFFLGDNIPGIPDRSLILSPDGKKAITASFSQEKVIDLNSKESLFEFPLGSNAKFNWSRDGKMIITTNEDEEIIVRNADTGEIIQNIGSGLNSSLYGDFSPDGNKIAISSIEDVVMFNPENGKYVHVGFNKQVAVEKMWHTTVWDCKEGKILFKKLGSFLKWSSDSKIVVTRISGDANGSDIWGTKNTCRLWDSNSGELRNEHKGNDASWSPNGNYYSIYNEEAEKVILMDGKTGDSLQCIENYKYEKIPEWHKEGNKIFALDHDRAFNNWAKTAIIWDIITGKQIDRMEIISDSSLNNMKFPSEKNTLDLNNTNSLDIFNTVTGKKIRTISLGSYDMYDISYKTKKVLDPRNCRFRMIDMESGYELLTISFIDTSDYVIVTPDGYFDGTPNGIKQLYYVQGLEIIPIEKYYDKYYRPDLWRRVMTGEVIN
ncbi:MAG: WD40 repeat domain-containing protein [Bacteroidetes bacterium]|nr:WD40 repeat domain-containing protein [Bacteroidota bacterium]MBU1720060.1 WD40 repeat domain-containing protein [Bacteroidota bacterium]